jgi:hypothetical protein
MAGESNMKLTIDSNVTNFGSYVLYTKLEDRTPKEIWDDSRLTTIKEIAEAVFPRYTDEELANAGPSDKFLWNILPSGLIRDELYRRGYYS